jgi:hypothetical protein
MVIAIKKRIGIEIEKEIEKEIEIEIGAHTQTRGNNLR